MFAPYTQVLNAAKTIAPPAAQAFSAATTANVHAAKANASVPTSTFAAEINAATGHAGGAVSAGQKQAQKAAAGLVADALILPMLEQVRRDPFGKNTVFSGGIGERTFGPQFDMQIADRIANSPNMALTGTLTGYLLRRGKPVSRAALTRAEGLDAIQTHAMMDKTLDVHG